MPTDARRPVPKEFSLESAPATSQQTNSHQMEDSHITVKRGDTLWGLAAHHLNDPERWVDIYDTNQDIIQDPSVIVPGWQLQLPVQNDEPFLVEPPAPVTEPPSRMTAQASPVLAYATAPTTVVARVPPTEADGPFAPGKQSMFAVGGLGVFASSLGWVLARLRRTQRRRLPNGRMPPLPSSDAVRLEQQLETASDPESALFLDASLRVLSSRMAGCTPFEIIGASLDSAGMSIHLGAPSEAPPGFDANEDSMIWSLPRGPVLEPLLAEADGVPAPIPALAAIGKTDGREFLLNLEHVGALNLQGDPQAISSLCSAMATQLASSHLADDLTVLCVGFNEDLAVFERVEYVPDANAAIERIAHLQRQNRALLGSHSPSAGSRIGSHGDYWHPTVTLVPHQLSESEATGLLEVCGSSVCIVAHGLSGATWAGQFDEHGLLLQPVGLRLKPHGLSDLAVATVAELATSAKDFDGVTLAGPPTPTPVQLQDDSHPVAPPPVDVEVRVLGTVDVLGAAQPFTSRRALDLVAYLAFHPEGADRDQLRTHIWPPDDPPTESTLANTVSRARKALGVNDHDEPYLPRVSSKGIYQLSPEVGTDVRRFETLVSAARNDPSEHGRQQLEAAFELIRGTPFTGGAGDMFRWADFGLRTQIDCLVDTTAHELAKRCIEAGEADRARHAVMTSLRLVGICEQCYRWRLMAAAENPTEVRQIMAELMGLLRRDSDQPEADDLISPELLELYERLMSGQAVFS